MDAPNILGNSLLFVCWAGTTGKELPNHSNVFRDQGSQNESTLGKKYALHVWDFQAPSNKSCQNFRPHGVRAKDAKSSKHIAIAKRQ